LVRAVAALVDEVVTATVLPRAHNTAVRALRELGASAHRPVFRRADALQQLPCGAEEREDALRHCVLAGEAVEVKLSSSALRMLAAGAAGAPEPGPGPLPEEKQAAVVRREACVLLGAAAWYSHLLRCFLVHRDEHGLLVVRPLLACSEYAGWYPLARIADHVSTEQMTNRVDISAVGADAYEYGAKSVGSILINRMKVAGS
jgi:hypothetical protein